MDIVKFQNVSLSTVKRVANHLKNYQSLIDRLRSGRTQVIQPENVRKAFLKNPTLEMPEFTKKKIFVATVSRAVKSEGGKSLKRPKRPLLTSTMVKKRQERCTRLLNDLKSHSDRVIIFSDEKTFTVDLAINKQNDRVVSFGQDISGVRYASTTKHPASAMMLDVVASNGKKMPSVWFKGGYRLTGTDCREIMATKVFPWIRKIVKDDDYRYVFQQDGAPVHTSKVVQDWMSSNMTFRRKDFWPPQSPDLSPLDYSVWPHIESKACKDRHNNTEELKASVNRSWTLMSKDYVRKVCKDFRPRLSRVIAASGGLIE